MTKIGLPISSIGLPLVVYGLPISSIGLPLVAVVPPTATAGRLADAGNGAGIAQNLRIWAVDRL